MTSLWFSPSFAVLLLRSKCLFPMREGNYSKMTLIIDERDELRFDDDSHLDLLYVCVCCTFSTKKAHGVGTVSL